MTNKPPAKIPEYNENERAQFGVFREKLLSTPSAPYVTKEGGSHNLRNPEQGGEMLLLQLFNMTGVTDYHAGCYLLNQIGNTVKEGNENAGFAIITQIQPKDPIEGMLAAQMLAAHNMAMNNARLSINGQGLSMKQEEHNGKMAMNAMRLYAAQVEALAKHRNKGRQKITVQHQYIDNRNGQAVIGDVNPGGGGGRA